MFSWNHIFVLFLYKENMKCKAAERNLRFIFKLNAFRILPLEDYEIRFFSTRKRTNNRDLFLN